MDRKSTKMIEKQKLKKAIDSNLLLKDFLLKENCYGKFISAIINNNNIKKDKANNIINKLIRPKDILNAIFIWNNCPQGYRFWYDKYLKAEIYYNNYINNQLNK